MNNSESSGAAVGEVPDVEMDIFGSDAEHNEAVVATGVGDRDLSVGAWMESHSTEGGPGPHLAIRQRDAEPLVVHLSQVPALVAGLTEVSLWLAQHWEREGQAYWDGRPRTQAPVAQDSNVISLDASLVDEAERREARGRRRAAKRQVFAKIHAHAAEVLDIVLAAEDDEDAATRLAPLLETSEETATEVITHLQFRELTETSRRRILGDDQPGPR